MAIVLSLPYNDLTAEKGYLKYSLAAPASLLMRNPQIDCLLYRENISSPLLKYFLSLLRFCLVARLYG